MTAKLHHLNQRKERYRCVTCKGTRVVRWADGKCRPCPDCTGSDESRRAA